MSRKHQRFVVSTFCVALLIAPAPGVRGALAQSPDVVANQPSQVPQPPGGGVNWSGVGYGAAATLGTVVYTPAKVCYALLGGLLGGVTWLMTAGNIQTADTIWRSSLGGDYVLTADMISGERTIHFNGPTQTSPVRPLPGATGPAASSTAVTELPPIATGGPAGYGTPASSVATAPSAGESAFSGSPSMGHDDAGSEAPVRPAPPLPEMSIE